MKDTHFRHEDVKKEHLGVHAMLSVIGGMLFGMGCQLSLSKENVTGVLLITGGAFLLGALITSIHEDVQKEHLDVHVLFSIIGAMLFVMGCQLSLSKEDATGILLITGGALLLGASVTLIIRHWL